MCTETIITKKEKTNAKFRVPWPKKTEKSKMAVKTGKNVFLVNFMNFKGILNDIIMV
jgi:hypothetical protein